MEGVQVVGNSQCSVAFREQYSLQVSLEHEQRRWRRDEIWQTVPHSRRGHGKGSSSTVLACLRSPHATRRSATWRTWVSNGKWNSSRFSRNVPLTRRRSTTNASQLVTSYSTLRETLWRGSPTQLSTYRRGLQYSFHSIPPPLYTPGTRFTGSQPAGDVKWITPYTQQ